MISMEKLRATYRIEPNTPPRGLTYGRVCGDASTPETITLPYPIGTTYFSIEIKSVSKRGAQIKAGQRSRGTGTGVGV